MSDRPKVLFMKTITPENIVEIFKKLEKPLEGKVGIKVHSGEKGNKNFLKPEFFKPIVEHLNGTIIECNTAYPGERNTIEKHRVIMDEHEWTKYFKVDILDADEPDIKLDIPNGIAIKITSEKIPQIIIQFWSYRISKVTRWGDMAVPSSNFRSVLVQQKEKHINIQLV